MVHAHLVGSPRQLLHDDRDIVLGETDDLTFRIQYLAVGVEPEQTRDGGFTKPQFGAFSSH